MLELIAEGAEVGSRWRRRIPEREIFVGRATETYRVPWDSQISRVHISLCLAGDRVRIQKLKSSSNPVFYDGKSEECFELGAGEHFVIGKTQFTIAVEEAFASLDAPDPISQKTFSADYLRKVSYRDVDRRIDVLSRLPTVIATASDNEDLLIQIVNTLMQGIASASTVGLVRVRDAASVQTFDSVVEASQTQRLGNSEIEIMQWDRRDASSGGFQPSETLVKQALESSESVLHIWSHGKDGKSKYTIDYENDWAFVSPISSSATPGWGVYVAGKERGDRDSSLSSVSQELDFQGDLKFCELVGSSLRNLLLVKKLERQEASLRTFFSPVVMKAISVLDSEEVLQPRECDLSVLFCDLRGFSKTSEQLSDDLLELLDRVSEALGITTSNILDFGGVIGDFHGDSAMGFWGWPIPPKGGEQNAVSAVKAALSIHSHVDNHARLKEVGSTDRDDRGFQFGIGIASGESVAGKIGTRDQVKVTAFGPVVNLASRLEGMTKWLNSKILIDAGTLEALKADSKFFEEISVRGMGNFQPFGMEGSFDVFQVCAATELGDEDLVHSKNLLEQFRAGEWMRLETELAILGAEDSLRMFLEKFIGQSQGKPPDGWCGTIEMQTK
ncbi:MAG: adenylate/guanylate cyclase domain-containing protein [Planctomycetaceae bacterium]|nr:adenylate/guanylate cyclase domain-containing protein [Planctomycetaceae bacterium]MCP4777583.1 adenylate/guanylate cyclase domain-containing protein [Planctomycetaceae bacterium]